MAFKIKFEILEKRMKTQENVLSLEKLIREWKMDFSDERIQELKKFYGINAEINSFNYQIIKDKKKTNMKIEYLKSSQIYKKYIDQNLLNEITPEGIINNINSLIQGKKIDFGPDPEIDYSKVNE